MFRAVGNFASVAAVSACLCLAVPASAGNSPEKETATTLHPILDILQNIYWRSYYGQITLPKDKYGNAVISDLVMMALPNAPGDGTPASISLTLSSHEPFFLPLWNLQGNSYVDGSKDPLISLQVFNTLDLTLTLDGMPIVNAGNLMQHFSQFYFVPVIPYNFPPATAFIWEQGISVLHGPLSPGTHTLKLDAKNTDTADLFGLTFEYHNTWNLTVK